MDVEMYQETSNAVAPVPAETSMVILMLAEVSIAGNKKERREISFFCCPKIFTYLIYQNQKILDKKIEVLHEKHKRIK